MNVFWVAQDNNKNGTYSRIKAEVICTLSSAAIVKQLHPGYVTSFYLDDYTKKYYSQFNGLEIFEKVDTTILNKEYDINYNIFYAASKNIVMNEIKGPVLNLDLDFHYKCDLGALGMFDSDISALWMEKTKDDGYPNHEKGLEMAPLPYNMPREEYALCVCFYYIKNGFFRELLSQTQINFMKTASKSEFAKEWEKESYHRNIFMDQYIPYIYAKNFNQRIKVIIDDYCGDINEIGGIDTMGLKSNDAAPYLYHFGSNKQKMREDDDYQKIIVDWIYENSIKIIKNQRYLDILKEIYDTPMKDSCFY